jgi:hypothetical protein
MLHTIQNIITKKRAKQHHNINSIPNLRTLKDAMITTPFYYCRDLGFKVEGLINSELVSQFENLIQSLKFTDRFWIYKPHLHLVLADDTTMYVYDSIVNPLNILVSWLNSHNCDISGSFCYRTDKYIGMIYILPTNNTINHVIISDITNDIINLDLLIGESENKIRQYLKHIHVEDIPRYYI